MLIVEIDFLELLYKFEFPMNAHLGNLEDAGGAALLECKCSLGSLCC